MNRKAAGALGLIALFVLFFALNVLTGATLSGARLDLTERNLYTLSDGTRSILRNLEEPIRMELYWSRSQAAGRPNLQTYAKRVRETLEQYQRVSGGTVTLEEINPEPFSDAEDRAVSAGLQGQPVGPAGESLYFGLVATNSTDGREVIPFFPQIQERFLEYELSRIVYSLSTREKRTVGVISGLPVMGPSQAQAARQRGQQSWQIIRDLREIFEVQRVDPGSGPIDPAQIDALLIIHPKGLSDAALYAIDQYVLAGGRAAVFVDPHAEVEQPPQSNQNPLAAMRMPRESDLDPLLEAWGVRYSTDQVAGDREHARRVQMAGAQRQEPVPYVVWLALGRTSLAEEDPITGRLNQINVASSGFLAPTDDARTSFTPLLRTSERSMRIDVRQVRRIPQPQALLTNFQSGGERLTLAARVNGPAETAFPDGAPEGFDAGEDHTHLTEASEPINIIVGADVDLAHDRLWLRQRQLFGGYAKLADNGDFVINALDNLSGSSDLIGLRASGSYNRPFELVQQIRREAEQEYLAEKQRLEEELRQTQQKIQELRSGEPQNGEVILTEQQQEEIDKFREQLVQTRKELRRVQHKMREDIESLGTTLKLINIAAAPALVALAAIGLGMYRASRRRADRLASGRS